MIMKQVKMFFLAAVLSLCSLGVLTSCANEDNNSVVPPLSEQIVGKWMMEEYDDMPVITDEKVILNFVSPDKCLVTMLLADDEEEGGWVEDMEFDVTINGQVVTLFGQLTEDISVIYEMQVNSIVGNDLLCYLKMTDIVDGEASNIEYTAHCVRTTTDNSADIIGIWEGYYKEDEDENIRCRFEFKDDETYNFYYFNDASGEWTQSVDDHSFYFCNGDVLYMRWKNPGSASICEAWDITDIGNGVMKWYALRNDDNGSIYELTTDFTKVQE